LYLNNENANINYYNWCFHLLAINSFKHFCARESISLDFSISYHSDFLTLKCRQQLGESSQVPGRELQPQNIYIVAGKSNLRPSHLIIRSKCWTQSKKYTTGALYTEMSKL